MPWPFVYLLDGNIQFVLAVKISEFYWELWGFVERCKRIKANSTLLSVKFRRLSRHCADFYRVEIACAFSIYSAAWQNTQSYHFHIFFINIIVLTAVFLRCFFVSIMAFFLNRHTDPQSCYLLKLASLNTVAGWKFEGIELTVLWDAFLFAKDLLLVFCETTLYFFIFFTLQSFNMSIFFFSLWILVEF